MSLSLSTYRLFFFTCFVVAAYNALNFAVNIIEKWQTSSILIMMNPEVTQITDSPFPAITICNMNQASYKRVKDYPVDSLEYAMLQKLCFHDTKAKISSRNKNGTLAKFIVANTQSCSEMILMCKWGLEVTSCTDFFREVLLNEGLCCSFNIVHPFAIYKGEYFMVRDFTSLDSQWIPVEWNPETGYTKDLPKKFYPRLALGSGLSNGLTLVLNGDVNDYYCSSTNGAGFKFQLHNPIDSPQIKETGLLVSLGSETTFHIDTFKDEALPEVRSISPKNRQCYFNDEYKLQYFRFYTRRNCEAECEAIFFLQTCNCIPHQIPHVVANATTCHIEHTKCLTKAALDYTNPQKLKCKSECLPGCYDLAYRPKMYSTVLAKEHYNLNNKLFANFTPDYIKENLAVINVYFPHGYYRSNVKTPYTGITEYLSQTGGIMGLMMGLSVISVVEFIYFLVMKPVIHMWRRYFAKNIVKPQGS